MKKLLFIVLLVTLALTSSIAWAHEESSEQAASSGENQMAEAKAVYTCPMHSEVRQTTPGKCPKCGMTLVQAKEQADAETTEPMEHEHMTEEAHSHMH